ncbi:MAG: cation transporter [Deltaproteobacteria bacterium]|nr:cation transporter [Deltaproteobacteria bacterium]
MVSRNTPTRFAVFSLVAGTLILAAKMFAWWLTGSAAILADALESVVNVIAAAVAVFATHVAAQPLDADHPYGHGKVELLSAAFEGGAIAAAALGILWSGGRALLWPPGLRHLDIGMGVSVAAAAANAGLGLLLLRAGKVHNSEALRADGQHVLSDVWTSVGALAGVALAWGTGVERLDGTAAVLTGLALAWHGVAILRRAMDGLMDAEDPEFVARVRAAFEHARVPGVHGLHRVRAIRSGTFVHVDAHIRVPGDWTVQQAHAVGTALEEAMKRETGITGEFALHMDPWSPPPHASVQ